MPIVRASPAILAMMLFANSVHCADTDRKPLDEESLRSYMAENMTSSAARLIRVQLTMDM